MSGIASVAFALFGLKIATTAIWYQDEPRTGALVNAAGTVVFAAVLLLLIGFSKVAIRWPRWRIDTVACTALVLWFGASIYWTEARSTSSSLGYWIELAAEAAIVVLLMSAGTAGNMLLRSIQGYIVGTVVVLGYVLITGMRAADGRLGSEAFLHPNTLGNSLAVGALCAAFLALYNRDEAVEWSRSSWAVVGVVLVAGLALSLSKTSIAAFGGGMLVLLIRREMSQRSKLFAVGAGCLITLGSIGPILGYWNEYAGGASRSVSTLTGRTDIWDATWPEIEQAPIIGHGLLSFRDVGPQIADVRLVHAHNEALQLLFAGGAVALALTILTYGAFLWNLRAPASTRDPSAPTPVSFRPLAGALMAFILLRGLTEASATAVLFPLPFLYAFAFWSSEQHGARGTA